MDVAVLTDDDWKLLQDVRLLALDESPAAFLSTYEAEASLDEAGWRSRCRSDVWIVARSGGQVVGVVCSVRAPDRPADERHLESVWVDPAYRRRGVLRAILRHLAIVEPEVRTWLVWVLSGNDEARSAYERLGFAATGERQPLTGTSGRTEERLALDRKAAPWDADDRDALP